MGYELVFHFHEKDENGKFDLDESTKQTFTKNIGRRNAEISLEQVAAVIMGQLARRDIYVVNVEVYEYAKREITFKETKEGVTIKGKKFNFDQLHGVLKSDDDEEQPNLRPNMPQLRKESFEDLEDDFDLSQFKPSMPSSKPEIMPNFNIPSAPSKPKVDPNIPLRQELYHPHKEDYSLLQRQGYKLTMGKPYPIFKEFVKNPSEPVYYLIKDDVGTKVEINSSFFEPMRRGLVGIGLNDPQMSPPEGRLSYVDYGSGVIERGGIPTNNPEMIPMPNLRRNL